MLKNYPIGLLTMCVFSISITAQTINDKLPEELQLTAKDTMIARSNMVGLGLNIIMDTGKRLNNFPGKSEEWHMVPYPSRVSFGRNFRSGLSLEGIATVNKFMEGKLVEQVVLTEDRSFFSVDSRLSYNINRLFGRTGWFDPYVGAGLGYTSIEGDGQGTYNGVVGIRTWLSERWGIDVNTSGKWSMGDGITNYMQHAAGVVYQFNIEKELNKEGKDKLRLIEEYLREQKRLQDSITAAQLAEEEARRLAERLEREKEAAELAAAEKAKEEAERKLKDTIRKKLEDAGFAYFGFDSSYLTSGAKEVLDLVADFLTEYPKVNIKITAHADSRGTEEYNQWLSDRRAERTLKYLFDKGISAERINAEGKGETELRNDCEDGVPCPETKHSENRRSQFIVLEF
ncbi:MAG: OmpA family protein [Flavobacteriaceae bacterium]|nr:OmpA family protein [Flavobacteriaceae bacterium]